MRPNFRSSSWFGSLAILAITFALISSLWAESKYRVVHNFAGGLDGVAGQVIVDSAGNLYGLSTGGGAHSAGLAFELSPSGGKWKVTVLYNFCSVGGRNCTDGASPMGSLASDAAGNLYGGTGGGGSGQQGLIFQLSPGAKGWTENILYQPGAWGFVLDATGNLCGLIGAGRYDNGAVGELSPSSGYWTYTELYSFNPYEGDGFLTDSPLIFDGSGDLYGTNQDFGSGGAGTVFRVEPPFNVATGEWTEHLLHSFPAFKGDGQQPYAGLAFDANGNLYGATESGGGGQNQQWCPQSGCGTVFKLTPNGHGRWKETILHRFAKFEDGINPMGTLALDQSGNIYGTTAGGGIGGGNNLCLGGGCGTVFKLTPSASGKWTYTVLHRFNGKDGAFTFDGLAMDKQGNLYGDTIGGGKYGYGVVFQIRP